MAIFLFFSRMRIPHRRREKRFFVDMDSPFKRTVVDYREIKNRCISHQLGFLVHDLGLKRSIKKKLKLLDSKMTKK